MRTSPAKRQPYLLPTLKRLTPGNYKIKKHAKSFYLAQLFLRNKDCQKIKDLYELCRLIDDTADDQNLSNENALKKLQQFEAIIHETSENNIIAITDQLHIKTYGLLKLIEGMKSDRQHKQPTCLQELITYCYQAAGTVGLMICDAMKIDEQRAKDHAICLGIAMQITNITRDIWEDALNQRVYLPKSLVGNISPEDILQKKVNSTLIKKASKHLLETADLFYHEGNQGLPYIAKENRFAIYLASELYRNIGIKIALNGHTYAKTRAYCSTIDKLLITVGCLKNYYKNRESPAITQADIKKHAHITFKNAMESLTCAPTTS